jgi:hypothetical protein
MVPNLQAGFPLDILDADDLARTEVRPRDTADGKDRVLVAGPEPERRIHSRHAILRHDPDEGVRNDPAPRCEVGLGGGVELSHRRVCTHSKAKPVVTTGRPVPVSRLPGKSFALHTGRTRETG